MLSSAVNHDMWAWAKHTQSPVALAISSPTFLGDKPRGPILGARAEEAPTSPPVALKVLHSIYVSLGTAGARRHMEQ